MTKITLKIERHYGNENFKTIMENLVSIKLSDSKFNNEASDKPYCNRDNRTTTICKVEDEG